MYVVGGLGVRSEVCVEVEGKEVGVRYVLRWRVRR